MRENIIRISVIAFLLLTATSAWACGWWDGCYDYEPVPIVFPIPVPIPPAPATTTTSPPFQWCPQTVVTNMGGQYRDSNGIQSIPPTFGTGYFLCR